MCFQSASSQQAFQAWREQVHGVFNGLETEARADSERFSAHLMVDQAPGLRVGDIEAGAQTVIRTRGVASRSNSDEVGLLIQLVGSARVDHGNAHIRLAAGEALLLDNTRAYRLDMPERFRQAVVLVRRELWASRLPALEDHVGHRVPACGIGRVLLAFARSTIDECGRLSEEGMFGATAPLMDLICGAYGHGKDKGTESRSVAALRQRIHKDIRENLTSTELSPSELAKRHGISVRYLHRLFQMRGQSVMGHVAEHRMQLCQRLLLGSPGRLRTADLAFACGYADDSTFRRAFRAHFGCSVRGYKGGASAGQA